MLSSHFINDLSITTLLIPTTTPQKLRFWTWSQKGQKGSKKSFFNVFCEIPAQEYSEQKCSHAV